MSSYLPYVQSLYGKFPPHYFVWLGAYVYYTVGMRERPPEGMREISTAEYKGTPTKYLLHPDHHPVPAPKVPGQKKIADYYGDLHHAAEAKLGHGHGHGHH